MEDLIENACSRTIVDERFVNDYVQLTRNELTEENKELTSAQISKLLKTASLFSLSSRDNYQKLSFKIAVYLLKQYRLQYEAIPLAVELIITRLGDLPAISSILQNDEGLDYFSLFDELKSPDILSYYMHFPEILAKKVTNIATIKGSKKPLVLTDFQSRVFFLLQAQKNVAFSAPTSAGKSYMVHHYIAQKIKQSETFCAVYIVPTRALIAEVQDNIRQTILELGVDPNDFSVFVSANKLNTAEIAVIPKKVFVLTQERLQEAMSNDPLMNVDLLVIDEAQKVSEESRGIIIQDAVDDLLTQNPKTQKLFIAPHIDNPEDFKSIFGVKDDVIPERTSKSPVGQNILGVTFDNRSVTLSARSYELGIKIIPLRQYPLDVKTTSFAERKAWVATHLIRNEETRKDGLIEYVKEPTIVYCDGPADCRRVAEKIAKLRGKQEISSKLLNAIEFFSQQVHEDYYLCEALSNGIGYHYGKMPQFIKFYIKDLFDDKQISILCCTNTLLEGVNMPAKNVVLCHPKTGHDIARLSLLNLAGRAGRLMKDHYGKIYCIDMAEWKVDGKIGFDAFEDTPEYVQSSVDRTLKNNMELLVGYLVNPYHQGVKRGIKRLATSLMMKYLKKRNREDVVSFLQRSKNILLSDIELVATKIEDACQLILPDEIILKNRTFDPRFQNDLYITLKGTEYITLPFPDSDKYFYWKMKKIFFHISTYLFKRQSRRWSYLGVLGANWILEKPYREILDGKIEHNKAKENETEKEFHNRIIEDLDVDIERALKYDYTRGLKCYSDIVKYIADEENEFTKHGCEELPVYLEWGTFNKNTLFFMELGLSRSVSILLNKRIGVDLSTSKDCLSWLRLNEKSFETTMPDIFYKEIVRLLENKKPK